MFCKTCGTPVPVGVKYCPQCGTPAGGNAGRTAAGGKTVQKSRTSGRPPVMAIAVGVIFIVAVIALVIFLFRLIFGNGYEKPIKALAQGMEEQDGEKVLSAFSEKTIRYLEDGYQMDTRDVERYYNDYIYIMTDENLEDEDYTIEYEIESSKKLSRDDIKDIRDELKDNYDIREDISEAREVDVVFTVFVDDIEEDQIDVEMDVLKIEGDWYISFLTTDDLPSL